MSHVKNLERARKTIENPGDWTKSHYDDGFGRRCMVGSFFVQRPAWSRRTRLSWVIRQRKVELEYLAAATNEAGDTALDRIVEFNDFHRHHEVLAAFDRAIEMARADEMFEFAEEAREEDLATAGD